MIKVAVLMLGLLFTGFASAENNTAESPDGVASHVVTIDGLKPGEGRYIRGDIIENNKYKSGYYFCAGAEESVYYLEYFFSKNHEPFHVDHLIKFSICQDETMAECHEFATDKYQTTRNDQGNLVNDISVATIDASSVKNAYQSCEPNADLESMVKKAIHLSDRRFAHVG